MRGPRKADSNVGLADERGRRSGYRLKSEIGSHRRIKEASAGSKHESLCGIHVGFSKSSPKFSVTFFLPVRSADFPLGVFI